MTHQKNPSVRPDVKMQATGGTTTSQQGVTEDAGYRPPTRRVNRRRTQEQLDEGARREDEEQGARQQLDWAGKQIATRWAGRHRSSTPGRRGVGASQGQQLAVVEGSLHVARRQQARADEGRRAPDLQRRRRKGKTAFEATIYFTLLTDKNRERTGKAEKTGRERWGAQKARGVDESVVGLAQAPNVPLAIEAPTVDLTIEAPTVPLAIEAPALKGSSRSSPSSPDDDGVEMAMTSLQHQPINPRAGPQSIKRQSLARMANRARQLHAIYLTSGSHDADKWAHLLKEYASLSSLREAALVYARNLPRRTHHQRLLPASRAAHGLGRSLHAEALKSSFSGDLLVGTTLVSMYCKCGALEDARRAFDETPDRNVVTCNALLAGYAAAGDMDAALALFDGMPSWTSVTWATLIRGFAEKGDMAGARRWFDATPPGMRNVVTWTVVVQGYVAAGDMETAREVFDRMPVRERVRVVVHGHRLLKAGDTEAAQEAFHSMMEERIKPDEFTMASVLSACAQFGSLEQGKKCGDLAYARGIFDSMRWKNTECWNTMISALASHGRSEEALQLFFIMERSEQKPNVITLLAVLGACTHGGFVDEGLRVFNNLEAYDIEAGVELYGCLLAECMVMQRCQDWSRMISVDYILYIMLSNIMAASERWNRQSN
ncbi:hypothetical protein HU200_007052 [Digitaria exilis]|uniref:Pentatricopeptide repeat-containing protein n=1 Tax=Digitaria exilis TaxID=1010633 RepID=A0A835KQ48_9POAL|nr:hypothetical protein HU200_007052 [Digitaria exilis]